MLFRKSSDARVSFGLFVLSIAVLVTAALYAVYCVQRLVNEYRTVEKSRDILEAVGSVRAEMEGQAASLANYVITGDGQALAGYRKGVSDLTGKLSNLNALIASGELPGPAIDNLREAIASRLAASEGLVETYRQGGIAKAGALIVEDEMGPRTMNDARTAISALEAAQHELLIAGEQRLGAWLRAALLAGGVGIAVFVLIQCVVFSRMDRESGKRRDAETSLLRANDELTRSLEDVKRNDRTARAMSRFGEILQNCRSVDETIAITMHHCARFLPDVSVAIGLFRQSQDAVELFECAMACDNAERFLITNLMSHECWGLRTGRPHAYRKDGYEPRCEHVKEAAVESTCIPIVSHGQTLGVLSFHTERPSGAAPSDGEIAVKTAERLGPVLANLTLQETLRSQSVRDPLTSLFNRRYLEESLVRELSRARRDKVPVSVMMLDIDHFKQFNDEYGHEGGDLVLTSFGQLLVREARSEDITCRYGGEEFALVLPGVSHELALQRAEGIRLITEQMRVASRGFAMGQISVSIGVATYPAHGETADSVLGAADAALYLAKNSGRNRVVGACALTSPDRRERSGDEGGSPENRRNKRDASAVI